MIIDILNWSPLNHEKISIILKSVLERLIRHDLEFMNSFQEIEILHLGLAEQSTAYTHQSSRCSNNQPSEFEDYEMLVNCLS